MCRYAMVAYKPHYACFECRKTFKRRLLVDIDRDAAYSVEREDVPSKCPECRGMMASMGLDFESPKKSDSKAWNHVRNLYESGITYHSCGCSGPGYIPKNKGKLIEFLNERKTQFIEHRRFWSNRIEPETESERAKDWNQNSHFLSSAPSYREAGTLKHKRVSKAQAITYWTEKINEIENQLKKLL